MKTKKPSNLKKPAPAKRKASSAARKNGNGNGVWNLRLYVAGKSPKSVAAYDNLKRMCEQHLAGKYSIEVIDLLKNPQLAKGDQILAIPTLVRKIPEPMKRIIGDLSDNDRALVGLDLREEH